MVTGELYLGRVSGDQSKSGDQQVDSIDLMKQEASSEGDSEETTTVCVITFSWKVLDLFKTWNECLKLVKIKGDCEVTKTIYRKNVFKMFRTYCNRVDVKKIQGAGLGV